MKTPEQKLAEMEALSKAYADKVKYILNDPVTPFDWVELFKDVEKGRVSHKDALSLAVYFSLHYGFNLVKLSTLVAVKVPIAGIILSVIGKALGKLGKHYHLKQIKVF